MSDARLIAQMAALWVDCGGDADGIMWNASKLRDAVQAEIDERKALDDARASIAASKAAFLAEVPR